MGQLLTPIFNKRFQLIEKLVNNTQFRGEWVNGLYRNSVKNVFPNIYTLLENEPLSAITLNREIDPDVRKQWFIETEKQLTCFLHLFEKYPSNFTDLLKLGYL